MFSTKTVAATTLAAFALAACGPNDDLDPNEPTESATTCTSYEPDPPGSTFVVGQEIGESATFYPLVADDTLPMEYGPQGGQHFYVSARLLGEGRDYTIRFTFSVGGQTHGAAATRVESCDSEWTAVSDVAVVLDSDDDVSGMLDVVVEGEGAPAPVQVPVSVSQ